MPNIRTAALLLTAVAVVAISGPARAQRVELKTAVETAMQTNPEINQAVENRTAIEFEREQAQGLFLPRVSVEGSAGIRRLENGTRRNLGIADDKLYPVEGSLRIEQMLFDGGVRSKEVKRQASRTDGAAFRVEERSQFIALQVTRQYLDYLLQQRIVFGKIDARLGYERERKIVCPRPRDQVGHKKPHVLFIADKVVVDDKDQSSPARGF